MTHPNEERYQEILEKIVKIADESFPVKCAGQFTRGSSQGEDGQPKWHVGIIIVRAEDHEVMCCVRLWLDDGKFEAVSPAMPGTEDAEHCSKIQAALRAAHFVVCRDEIEVTERELIQ
uniref:Uncharacterized protein n=1 Tax=Pseudomonas phage HRDY3 TaxID=3236930 RepID=A0AB39CDE4_9VIRU